MAIQYETELSESKQRDKNNCHVEILADVSDLTDGSKKKAEAGKVIFRRQNESDVEDTVVNGVAKMRFVAKREDEKSFVTVFAKYEDPRGIVTKTVSILVEIPAKEKQRDRADSRPEKITLFLGEPIAQVNDNEVTFKARVKLNAPPKVLQSSYDITIFLDDTNPPDLPRPMTNARSGERIIEFSLNRIDEQKNYLFSVRVTVDGKEIQCGRPYHIYVPARERNEDWEFDHWKFELTGKPFQVAPDRYRFILDPILRRFEKCTAGPKIGKVEEKPDSDQLPRHSVKFFEDWEWNNPLPEIPETDSKGHAEIETAKVFESGPYDKRITFLAEITIGDETMLSDPLRLILPGLQSATGGQIAHDLVVDIVEYPNEQGSCVVEVKTFNTAGALISSPFFVECKASPFTIDGQDGKKSKFENLQTDNGVKQLKLGNLIRGNWVYFGIPGTVIKTQIYPEVEEWVKAQASANNETGEN